MAKLKTVAGVLKRARRILEENLWTKGTLVRNRRGKFVSPLSKEAVSFCLFGAVRATDGDSEARLQAGSIICQIIREVTKGKYNGMGEFNDTRSSKKQVLSILERAENEARKSRKTTS
jgi:hypothetical protein